MMITHDYRPIKRDNLQKRDLEDGLVLHDQQTSQVFTLNTTAALIWEYCDGNTSVEVIAQELATACNVKKEDMLKDVINIITDFQVKGLLKIES